MRYKILFKDRDKVDKEVLKKVQAKHKDDIEGLNDLYEQLIQHGTCESTIAPIFYYTAYTLSLEGIEMILAQMN